MAVRTKIRATWTWKTATISDMEIEEVVAVEVIKTLTKAAGKKMLDVASQTLNDYRERNAPAFWTKFNSMVNPLGLEEPREVPPKIWYPIIDHGTLEDDDFLRTKYAALLANAVDPNFKHGVRPSFVEILKQLTSTEAKLVDVCYEGVVLSEQTGFVEAVRAATFKVVAKDMDLESSELNLVLRSLSRHGLLDLVAHPQSYTNLDAYDAERFAELNKFGYEFVAACRPPVVR